jgi:ribosomal protein S18 acetylase RimI-like enzyme
MTVRIEEYAGPRDDLLWSFRLAEDSESALASYLESGTVWVARDPDDSVVGHLQMVVDDDVWEILNTAVAEDRQGQGIGRRLLAEGVAEARRAGARRVVVATAAADVGNLRFYQRCGFRMERVVPDAFTPATGYPEPIEIDGIPLRDQVWFGMTL